MKKSIIVAVVASAVMMAGCNSEPSSGDIKDNLTRITDKCESGMFKVSDVEKVNGRQGNRPDEYVVAATYSVKYTPPKNNFLELYEEKKEKVQSFNAGLHSEMIPEWKQKQDKLVTENNDLKRTIDVLGDEVVECRRNNLHNPTIQKSDRQSAFEACSAEASARIDVAIEKMRRNDIEHDELGQKIAQNTPRDLPKMNEMQGWFRQVMSEKCKINAAEARFIRYSELLGGGEFSNGGNVVNGAEVKVTLEGYMVKTEKGWIFRDLL